MDVGRLLLRLTIGGTFCVHGTQKLFGWFGGYGPDGTGQFFESLGLRPGKRNAIAAGATEAGGGVLIALGLATPLAAAGLSAAEITALGTAVGGGGAGGGPRHARGSSRTRAAHELSPECTFGRGRAFAHGHQIRARVRGR